VRNVRDLSIDIRWGSFRELIAQTTSIPSSHLLLKAGFPPKPLPEVADDALVFPPLLTNGVTITAERSTEPISSTTSATPSSTSSSSCATTTASSSSCATTTASSSSLPARSEGEVSREGPPPIRTEPPLNSEGMVIRRVIPDDNSCLFNAVGYVLEGLSRSKAPTLRKLISDTVRSNPENFPDVFLERPNPEYAKWILEPKTWGGAIELAILSDHYQTEIGAIDVATSHMYCYGEGKSYRQRVYLVYDGLHYDALGLNFSPDGPEEFDMTVFSPQDSYVFNNALAIVRSLKQKHLYTDTAAFLLSCSDCQAVLVGEKGASEHATATGHTNFTEKR